MISEIIVRPVDVADQQAWRDMRAALYGEDPSHLPEIEEYFTGQSSIVAAFIAEAEAPAGFIELSLRDYAEGCAASPVAYIEGLYVAEPYRRLKVGEALVAAAEGWARSRGHVELASDTPVGNAISIAAHKAYGFNEAERIVCFHKKL